MQEWIKSLVEQLTVPMDEKTNKRAKLVLLDTLGAIIAGNNEPQSKRLLQNYQLENNMFGDLSYQGVPVYGTDYRLPLYEAGFVNGQSSVAIEMDEGNQYSKGHPAAHVVPILLTSLAYRPNTKGTEIINLLIIGYEFCSRFGRAVNLKNNAHAHGTWGSIGSAVISMLVEKEWNPENIAKAILLAASFVPPTQWNSATGGNLVRNLYAGHAIEYGLRIPGLVRAGYDAPIESLEHTFENVVGTKFNSRILTEPTQKWDIEQNYFKPYAFCRYVHAPIEAFKKAWNQFEKETTNEKSPKRIRVLTYKRASTLSNKVPSNILAAKFSIPYAISVAALYNISNHKAFEEHIMMDDKVRALCNKVEVEFSEELEKEYPEKMPAVVEIYNEKDEVFSSRVDIAAGGPGKELTENEIIDKFKTLSNDFYEAEIQNKIINTVLHLEDHTFGELLDLLVTVVD